MSSDIRSFKINPMNIKIVSPKSNLNDPIQARLLENKLTLKNSKLWNKRRRGKVYPIIKTTTLS